MSKTKLKRGGAVRSSRIVLLRLSLTPAESEALLALLQSAANEPGDVDAKEFESLRVKTERALAPAPVSNARKAIAARERFFDGFPPDVAKTLRENSLVRQAYYHGFIDGV